jgi:inosine/xanthosine triphosphatase
MRTIVVASKNPVKIQAAEVGFTRMFAPEVFHVSGTSVPSGVSHQPMTDAETRTGAQTRAANAQKAQPQADFWVGIEGGVDFVEAEMHAFAWVAIYGRDGRFGEARSASFALPPALVELIQQGVELGEADDRVFGRQNSKQENGAVGILTRDVVDRMGLYIMPVELALIPFCNEILYKK